MTDGRETERLDTLRRLELEVGVMMRRVRRVVALRAREVHPEMQASSYLMLTHVRDHGPVRAAALCASFDIDKAAVSRQLQHLVDLGLVDRTPDPDDGRATLMSITGEGVRRLADVADHRRKLLDERLGDWSADELAGFVDTLARYNAALAEPEDQAPQDG